MTPVGGPIRPHSGILAHASAAQGTERLINTRNQAKLTPSGRPLGECRLNPLATPLAQTQP